MLVSAACAVLRFAPSPTGALHLGHARSALIGARMAQAMGGRFLLRIEDIDATRLRPDFVSWIFEDLAWLGMSWEQPVLRQSEHFSVYVAAIARLQAQGLLYPCFATRAEILEASEDGRCDPDGAPLYPGLWRGRSDREVAQATAAGLAMCLRLDMSRALRVVADKGGPEALTFKSFDGDGTLQAHVCDAAAWGDVVIKRKETPTSYHLAVVVDDARQGVTHVTRGMDLLASTDVHRVLQVLLDLPEPIYHHHRLITDATGRKLSKSAGDRSLRALRAAGWSAEDVIGRALAADGDEV